MAEYILHFSTTAVAQVAGVIILVLSARLAFTFFFARKNFWWKRPSLAREEITALAERKGRELPFMSVFIPAREEASVIKNTIQAMTRLDYPLDRYEVTVVTDEKERRANPGGRTTQLVVEETRAELAQKLPNFSLRHEEVPYDFDGLIGGVCTGREVPSTKGRALNWALTRSGERVEFCVFFDAEGHPNEKALLAVANAVLEDPRKQVFQCPVFQVRNFWNISPFSKVASVAQAFTHEVFLPFVLRKLPFLGGTNLFIARKPLLAVGGFSEGSITEDLDLGVRLYLFANQWPHFLPIPSSEQTPASIRAYFKQRTRWGLGQLGVIDYLRDLKRRGIETAKVNRLIRSFLVSGPIEWAIYFSLTVVSFFVHVSRALQYGIFLIFDLRNASIYLPQPQTLTELVFVTISLAALPLLFFTLFLLFRYREYVAGWSWKSAPKIAGHFVWFVGMTLFILPFSFFLYPLPFIYACYKHYIAKDKNPRWVKTPRTAEAEFAAS